VILKLALYIGGRHAAACRREQQRTEVASLKIGHHRVHGYYLELGRSHDARVPADYRRRQTLKGTSAMSPTSSVPWRSASSAPANGPWRASA